MADGLSTLNWFPSTPKRINGQSWQAVAMDVGPDLMLENVQFEELRDKAQRRGPVGLELTGDYDNSFVAAFEKECNRVGAVYLGHLKQHLHTLERLLHSTQSAAGGALSQACEQQARGDVITYALNEVIQKVLCLDTFFMLNKDSLQSLYAEHLRCVPGAGPLDWAVPARGLLEPRGSSLHGTVVLNASKLCRIAQGQSTGDKWVPPDVFERSCTKHYVPLHRLFRLKLFLCRVVPVLQYKQSLLRDDDTLISCYYDSPSLECYKARLSRCDGAQLLRVRWYGTLTEDSKVFVEMKTHRTKSSGEQSSKERFPVPSARLDAFMAGGWAPDTWFRATATSQSQLDKWMTMAGNVQALIRQHSLRPYVLTVYRRTAFQDWRSNAVRISLDTDLRMVRLRDPATSSWLGAENGITATTRPEDVFHVPYGILEVKLSGALDPDLQGFVDELEAVVEPAGKFSKFLTGMAAHYPQQVPVLPAWWEEKAIAAAVAEHQDPSAAYHPPPPPPLPAAAGGPAGAAPAIEVKDVAVPPAEGRSDAADGLAGAAKDPGLLGPIQWRPAEPGGAQAVPKHPSVSSTCPSVVSVPDTYQLHPAAAAPPRASPFAAFPHCLWPCWRRADPSRRKKVHRKVDAKTHFANERTFIQWLTTAVLLATLSAGLAELGNVLGFLLMPVALLFAVYSLLRYYLRTRALDRSTSDGVRDLYGPAVLAVAVIAALGVSFWLAIFAPKGAELTPPPAVGLMRARAVHRLPFQFNALVDRVTGLARFNQTTLVGTGFGLLYVFDLPTSAYSVRQFANYALTSVAVVDADQVLLLSQSPRKLLRYDLTRGLLMGVMDLHCLSADRMSGLALMPQFSLSGSPPEDFVVLGGARGAVAVLRAPAEFRFQNDTACEHFLLNGNAILGALRQELQKALDATPNRDACRFNLQATPLSTTRLGCASAQCQYATLDAAQEVEVSRHQRREEVAHLDDPAVLELAAISELASEPDRGQAGVVHLLYPKLETIVSVDLLSGEVLHKIPVDLDTVQLSSVALTEEFVYYAVSGPTGIWQAPRKRLQ